MIEKIAIIGGGWYGCHLALVFKQLGYDVTIFEKNSDIFNGISGKFGIRLHAGPHYPRSQKTRKNCQDEFKKFYETYPDLIIEHDYSIYGLGESDVNEKASKVSQTIFESVCKEFNCLDEINPKEWGFKNIITALNIKEPSIATGERLREAFRKRLADADIKIIYNFEVEKLEKCESKISVCRGESSEQFDHVINATSYQALLPQTSLPSDIEIIYQPCLALIYKDMVPMKGRKPSSGIIMDGMFPCGMPKGDPVKEGEEYYQYYIVTHGKGTIVSSSNNISEAREIFNNIDDHFIGEQVRPFCEKDINRFWPEFKTRFSYQGWMGSVLAKPLTNTEFRSAITFKDKKTGVIYYIPGKVSDIFNVGQEAEALIKYDQENILSEGNYEYVRDGVLHTSLCELKEKLDPTIQNTCELQTYRELLVQKDMLKKAKTVIFFPTEPNQNALKQTDPIASILLAPSLSPLLPTQLK